MTHKVSDKDRRFDLLHLAHLECVLVNVVAVCIRLAIRQCIYCITCSIFIMMLRDEYMLAFIIHVENVKHNSLIVDKKGQQIRVREKPTLQWCQTVHTCCLHTTGEC